MNKKEYIEREAALEATTYNPLVEPDPTDIIYLTLVTAQKNIRKIPAADVAPVVHGEWCWEGKFKACSRCGSYVEWNETLGANFWNFCPYCGAKMDGGNNK